MQTEAPPALLRESAPPPIQITLRANGGTRLRAAAPAQSRARDFGGDAGAKDKRAAHRAPVPPPASVPNRLANSENRSVHPIPRGGNWTAASRIPYDGRSTPAHAGEPTPTIRGVRLAAVYPRPRGGTAEAMGAAQIGMGLSPPTRGNRVGFLLAFAPPRSIPAHAGEPCSGQRRPRTPQVYPRPRGGTREGWRIARRRLGLSPPTRGNRLGRLGRLGRSGSIPAHAGEPTRSPSSSTSSGVYPRPRGGTESSASGSARMDGLSPPTRGNRTISVEYADGGRSIPAHAGEPATKRPATPCAGVYPRPRGGTPTKTNAGWSANGLSPPTRGNPTIKNRCKNGSRSIPAHAGELRASDEGLAMAWVYPRPRGGTVKSASGSARTSGLSPPTRGNHSMKTWIRLVLGSIPAHAGEPKAWTLTTRGRLVYPRPRGGTRVSSDIRFPFHGLSPPTRGNLRCGGGRDERVGSIPAHAGEPRGGVNKNALDMVYPRPRGGTAARRLAVRQLNGLSPPTRGNRRDSPSSPLTPGSIPAHAGEPCRAQGVNGRRAVYPRPRGGTTQASLACCGFHGLSPPTRGNHPCERAQGVSGRSIPAHAGEPVSLVDTVPVSTVYPRPRGGTPRENAIRRENAGLSPPTRGNRKSVCQ